VPYFDNFVSVKIPSSIGSNNHMMTRLCERFTNLSISTRTCGRNSEIVLLHSALYNDHDRKTLNMYHISKLTIRRKIVLVRSIWSSFFDPQIMIFEYSVCFFWGRIFAILS